MGKEMKLVLLVGVLSMPRKGRRCPSESCTCILADSFSSDTLTSHLLVSVWWCCDVSGSSGGRQLAWEQYRVGV